MHFYTKRTIKHADLPVEKIQLFHTASTLISCNRTFQFLNYFTCTLIGAGIYDGLITKTVRKAETLSLISLGGSSSAEVCIIINVT